jgi:release factor family 2
VLPEIPRDVALHPGPVASIYLEVSRDRDGAPHEIRLRWEALAAQLCEQGADDKTVEAAGAAATETHSLPGAAGRAVFAADGRVLHEADLPRPPRRELARWATLPHLLPLLAQAPEYVPHVVVRVGRTAATITGFDGTGREVLGGTPEGQSHPAHKASGGGTAHYSMEHRTEEVWARNARAFAADVDRAVSQLHAELVVLTGDVRACSLVRDALGEHSRAISEQVAGPPPDDRTTAHQVGDEVRRLAAQRATRRIRDVLEEFEQEHGRTSGLAVTGLDPVIRALQLNQVRTLLLVDDPSSELEVWIGPEPMQLALTENDLRSIGSPVLGEDRADAALVRAVAGTGADLVLVPHAAAPTGGQPDLTDGIGALLRFTNP